jgi:hypothetical protein
VQTRHPPDRVLPVQCGTRRLRAGRRGTARVVARGSVRQRQPHALEYELASGQILSVQYTPIIEGGLVLAYADITARKRAEQEVARKVNLAARLQTHADLGGILLAHETHSLVKDTVLTEENGTITVKGFAKPVKTYRVVGLHHDPGTEGRVIRQEQEGLLLIIDQKKLTGKSRAEVIRVLQETLGRLTD